MRRTLALMTLAICLAGCQTASRQTIQVAYGDQLEQLEPGMTFDEFERVLPQAREFQRTFVGADTISVYRLDHKYKQEDDDPVVDQTLYFRFVNRQLERWGYSRTWGE